MEITYSKPILIVTIVVVALGVIVFFSLLFREEPVPDTSAPAQTLSQEDKLQIMRDLAQSSSDASLPIQKRERILQKAHSPASSQSGTSAPYSERQMEILHSLRYSEQ